MASTYNNTWHSTVPILKSREWLQCAMCNWDCIHWPSDSHQTLKAKCHVGRSKVTLKGQSAHSRDLLTLPPQRWYNIAKITVHHVWKMTTTQILHIAVCELLYQGQLLVHLQLQYYSMNFIYIMYTRKVGLSDSSVWKTGLSWQRQTCLSHAGIREPNLSHDCASGEALAYNVHIHSKICRPLCRKKCYFYWSVCVY